MAIPCTKFLSGSCAFGAKCKFSHDLAVASSLVAAKTLHGYVSCRGGAIGAGKISEFYKEHPDLKPAMGMGGELKRFCGRYPDLLSFVPDANGGRVVSKKTKGAATPTQTQDPSLRLVEPLVGFVALAGGRIHASELSKFYGTCPGARECLQGNAREFCEQHPEMLRFVDNNIVLACTASAPASNSPAAVPSSPASDIKTNKNASLQRELERVGLLWKAHLDTEVPDLIGADRESMKAEFVRFLATIETTLKPVSFGIMMGKLQQLGFKRHGTWATEATAPVEAASPVKVAMDPQRAAKLMAEAVAKSGGSIPSSQVASVYERHPGMKEAVNGKVRAFCERHPTLLRFQPDGGCGQIHCVEEKTGEHTSLQHELARVKVAMDPQRAAKLMAEAVAKSGGSIPSSQAASVYKRHPGMKEAVNGKVRAFCERHPTLLRFEPDGGCGQIHCVKVAVDPQRAAKLTAEPVAKSGGSIPSSQVSSVGLATAVPVRIKEPELERIALLWKQHLDSRGALIGEAKEVLRSAYLDFCQGMGAAPHFEEVMAKLRALGHQRHGMWAKQKPVQPDPLRGEGDLGSVPGAAEGGAEGGAEGAAEEPSEEGAEEGDEGHAATAAAGAQPNDPWRGGHDPWSMAVRGKETPDDASDNGTERLETMREAQPKKIDSVSLSVHSAASTASAASQLSTAILGAKTALEEVESLAASVQNLEQVLAAKRVEVSQLEARERRVAARERALDARQKALEDLHRELLGATEEVVGGVHSCQSGMDKLSACAGKLGAMTPLH